MFKLLESHEIYAAIFLFLFLISVSIKVCGQLIGFYRRNFALKWLHLVGDLRKFSGGIESRQEINRLLDSLEEASIFKVICGLDISPAFRSELIRLHNTGLIRISDFKLISPYLFFKDGVFLIKIKFIYRLMAWFTLLFGVAIIFYGGVVMVVLHQSGSLLADAVGAFILIVSIFLAYGVSQDFRNYKRLVLIKKKMKI
ncbi:hypothetical protein [Pseudomonas sp. Snoq117.2]|uniref:hypothetical protein n=1 Tax=Pseudomonas sp. Snoq117.2 TaxID=1500302 RepID=UPI0008AF95FB|nr:hypothetical protein [Pseudomonas sp. Snoq117.2]SEP27574.1 hypothetical protein SAMN02787149_105205 [Pseudomonas sp. Snoq117.2]